MKAGEKRRARAGLAGKPPTPQSHTLLTSPGLAAAAAQWRDTDISSPKGFPPLSLLFCCCCCLIIKKNNNNFSTFPRSSCIFNYQIDQQNRTILGSLRVQNFL